MYFTLKVKLLVALAVAGILFFYTGWTVLIILPAAVFLYGLNGSRWAKVDYIPQDGDQGVTYYFNKDGERYRNSGNETHHLVEPGKPDWAHPDNWDQR